MMYLSPTQMNTIHINGMEYSVVDASSMDAILKGMSIYPTPPNHGMLFHLRGRFTMFTMNGVKYPLRVYLYNSNKHLVNTFTAYPGDPDRNVLVGVWYMLEIPIK